MPLLVALLLIVVVTAGCGRQPSASLATAQAPTATPTTAEPSLTTQPTVDPAFLAQCHAQNVPANAITQSGDLLIFKPTDAFNDPAVRLPDQTPLKPLQVDTQVSNNALRGTAQVAGATAVNPGALTGTTRGFAFIVSICNASASATHVIQSVSVRIDTLTPFSGQLNVWSGCDLAFSRQDPNVGTGGCGGGVSTDEQVKAAFPAGARAGASATAKQVGFSETSNNPPLGPLPFHMSPGRVAYLWVGISVPDMAGTYAFSSGFQVDGAPTAFGPTADPYLAGPVAHTFSGAACNAPAMLAQIPPSTTPETYSICPA
jgi:hypothetical protein